MSTPAPALPVAAATSDVAAQPAAAECPALAFVDLDDTLFSSLRKQPAQPAGLEPAALLRSGELISWSNPAQRTLLKFLQATAEVIPVTARNVGAFRRVLIPFRAGAVVSHGATLLARDGAVDAQWAQRMAPHLAAARPLLEELARELTARFDPHRTGLRTRLVDDGGDPVYLVAKHAGDDAAAVRAAADTVVAGWTAAHPGFALHVNGNNLAVVPPGSGKAAAVAHVLERARRAGAVFALGVGDSFSDAAFMALCDVAVVPRQSQLAGLLQPAAGT